MTKFQKREMTGIAFGHFEIGKLDIIWNLEIGAWRLDY